MGASDCITLCISSWFFFLFTSLSFSLDRWKFLFLSVPIIGGAQKVATYTVHYMVWYHSRQFACFFLSETSPPVILLTNRKRKKKTTAMCLYICAKPMLAYRIIHLTCCTPSHHPNPSDPFLTSSQTRAGTCNDKKREKQIRQKERPRQDKTRGVCLGGLFDSARIGQTTRTHSTPNGKRGRAGREHKKKGRRKKKEQRRRKKNSPRKKRTIIISNCKTGRED